MRKLIIFIVLFILFCASFYAFDFYIQIPHEAKKEIFFSENVEISTELNAAEKELSKASKHFYEEYLMRTKFNGAMLVAKNGRIVFEKYNGLTEINKGEVINADISFHLASVSKTFTAMAILKLWQNNQLLIDDLVSKYLPSFPYSEITLRDLLSHRSGLPNYVHFMEALKWDTDVALTNQSLYEFIIQNYNKLRSGRHNAYFDYCNTNFALLALIIEKVSNLSYADFLDKTFFKPLGMEHTFVYAPEMKDIVLPSFKFNNQREGFTFLDNIYGDKNIYSTVRDMLKWDQAITDGEMFTKATLAEAFRGYSYERKGIKNYGLGWRLYELPSGKKIIYHNGWWHGNNTVFSRIPDDSTTIIVLGNKFNRSIYQAKKIIGIYDGYGFQFNEDD
jgi:CubicO group peptidase (beta-lactamase class C family)